MQNEAYLGLPIFRFYIKCTRCLAEITFKVDASVGGVLRPQGLPAPYLGAPVPLCPNRQTGVWGSFPTALFKKTET